MSHIQSEDNGDGVERSQIQVKQLPLWSIAAHHVDLIDVTMKHLNTDAVNATADDLRILGYTDIEVLIESDVDHDFQVNKLLTLTGTIEALFAESDDCVCCSGNHRYATHLDLSIKDSDGYKPNFTEQIQSFIHGISHGHKVRITVEDLNY